MALLLQAGVDAQPPPPEPPTEAPHTETVTAPQWLRRPTGGDLARVYPPAAVKRGLSGRATISCRVSASGELNECEVIEESPPEYGFGEAALKLVPEFRMTKEIRTGQSVEGGTVRIPIRFAIPGGQIDPLSGMLGCYGQTAVAAAKDKQNKELRSAYAFFAAQAALRQAEAGGLAATLETNLANARQAAERSGRTPGAFDPSLKQCLAAYRESIRRAE